MYELTKPPPLPLLTICISYVKITFYTRFEYHLTGAAGITRLRSLRCGFRPFVPFVKQTAWHAGPWFPGVHPSQNTHMNERYIYIYTHFERNYMILFIFTLVNYSTRSSQALPTFRTKLQTYTYKYSREGVLCVCVSALLAGALHAPKVTPAKLNQTTP